MKHLFRGWRHQGLTLVSVIIPIGIGVGANFVALRVIDQLLFQRPAGIASPSGLVRLSTIESTNEFGLVASGLISYPLFNSLAVDSAATDGLFAYATRQLLVEEGNRVDRPFQAFVSSGYFTLLGIQPALGSVASSSFSPDRLDVAAISFDYWQAAFAGDRNVVGQKIVVDGLPCSIVAVLPKEYVGLYFDKVDVLLPLAAWLTHLDGSDWRVNDNSAFLR